MKTYVLPRQAGNTTELVKLAAEGFLYVVCADRRRARHVAGVAERLGLDVPFPLTWAEFTGRHFHPPGVRGFVIDDFDACVQSMTAVPVRAVSLNGDDAGTLRGRRGALLERIGELWRGDWTGGSFDGRDGCGWIQTALYGDEVALVGLDGELARYERGSGSVTWAGPVGRRGSQVSGLSTSKLAAAAGSSA